MDVTEKKQKWHPNKKQLRRIQYGWSSRRKEVYSPEGYLLYTYQTLILEDFITMGNTVNSWMMRLKRELTALIKKW